MKIRTLLLLVLLTIVACKKDEKPVVDKTQDPVDSTDSTNTKPIIKDSTLKISLDTAATRVGFYDSTFITITINKDTGMAEDIELSLGTVPKLVKAELTQTKGKAPFTTTLKIYTYLAGALDNSNTKGDTVIDNASYRIIPISLVAKSQQNNKTIPLDFNLHVYENLSWGTILYDMYKKNPKLYTYDKNGNLLDSSAKLISKPGPDGYEIFLSNVLVPDSTSKYYRTFYDASNNGNEFIFYGTTDFGTILNIRGSSLATDGVDTINANCNGFSPNNTKYKNIDLLSFGNITLNGLRFSTKYNDSVYDFLFEDWFADEQPATYVVGKLIFD